MKNPNLLFSVVVAGLLVGATSGKAAGQQPGAVVPLDTFSFDITGFDFTSGTGYYLTPQETATFGVTTTYTGAGYNGQDITITSSEAIGASTTTDTFTVTSPTNFLTSPTINGTTINTLQFDLGDLSSGGNMVSLLLPIGPYTATGSTIYGSGSATTSAPLTPTTMLGANNSYSAAEGVNTAGNGSTPINTYSVHSFTYSITYSTPPIPEPSSWAMLGLAAIVSAAAIRRQRIAA